METPSFNKPSDEIAPSDTAGKEISFDEAISWTATYQEVHPGGLKSVFFSTSVFRKLLEQPDATGIRIYNAINPDGQECFVLVGATEQSDLTGEGNRAFDKGTTCPDSCAESLLNHN